MIRNTVGLLITFKKTEEFIYRKLKTLAGFKNVGDEWFSAQLGLWAHFMNLLVGCGLRQC